MVHSTGTNVNKRRMYEGKNTWASTIYIRASSILKSIPVKISSPGTKSLPPIIISPWPVTKTSSSSIIKSPTMSIIKSANQRLCIKALCKEVPNEGLQRSSMLTNQKKSVTPRLTTVFHNESSEFGNFHILKLLISLVFVERVISNRCICERIPIRSGCLN